MYSLSIVLFLAILVYFLKKLSFLWQKFCLIGVAGLLMTSTVYHTATYGKQNVWKASVDQEGFYYPKENKKYKFLENNLARLFLANTIKGKRHNVIYPIIYWQIKSLFGPKYFLEGFFFTSILNGILFLFSLYIFFKLVDKFYVSNKLKYLLSFIFLQPFVIFRNAIPLTNSLTIFSMVLFIYTMLSEKKLYWKLLSLFLCYLSHKTLWLPSISCAAILPFFYSKTYIQKLVLCVILLLGSLFIYNTNKENLSYSKYVATHYAGGTSSIPPPKLLLQKIPNFYFSPLITNSTLFFYKTSNGNWLGWIYAIYINFIVIFMSIIICSNLKNCIYLAPYKKQSLAILMIFIFSFSLAGTYLSNYLNANRHATNTLIIWVFAILILEEGRKIKTRKNSQTYISSLK